MEDVDLLGSREVMRRALEVANKGTTGFHFSFDMDGVDPDVAPGVGTPVAGGLSYREAHMLCELASTSGKMVAMDVMEV
jgi:arginase